VEVAEGLYAGLIRNVSENSPQIEILDNFKIGENIIYDDGVRGAIEGRDLYGIRNYQKASVHTENYFERGNSYRSIRIPVGLASTAWNRRPCQSRSNIQHFLARRAAGWPNSRESEGRYVVHFEHLFDQRGRLHCSLDRNRYVRREVFQKPDDSQAHRNFNAKAGFSRFAIQLRSPDLSTELSASETENCAPRDERRNCLERY